MVADYPSKIHHDEDDTTFIDDTFLDENLFHIDVQTAWYTDIANYIVANKMPTHFSYKEKGCLWRKASISLGLITYYFILDLIKL